MTPKPGVTRNFDRVGSTDSGRQPPFRPARSIEIAQAPQLQYSNPLQSPSHPQYLGSTGREGNHKWVCVGTLAGEMQIWRPADPTESCLLSQEEPATALETGEKRSPRQSPLEQPVVEDG